MRGPVLVARPAKLNQLAPALWRVLQHFWPYVRKRRLLMFGAFAALFVEVVMRILEPWPLKFIFDRIIPTQGADAAADGTLLETMTPGDVLVLSAIAVVIIAVLRAVASYVNVVGFALIGNRVLTEVRNDVYRHLQTLSLSFHGKSRTGDMIVRVIGDIGLLQDVTVTALLPLLGNLMVLAGMLGVMLWLNWQLAVLGLVVVPLFWLSSVRLGRRIRQVSRQQRQRESAMAATAAESIGAIKTIQALSLQQIFNQVFSSASNKSLKQGVQAKRLSANLERTVDVLIAIATALVLWYGTHLVLSSALTPGGLLVFLFYLKTAFKPVRNFAKYLGRLAKASAAGDRILELLAHEPGVSDLPDAVTAPPLRGAVEFDHVSFAYDNHTALRDLSFDVKAGQRIAVVGPSGAGKSTIVNLILRLYDPGSGVVRIDGQDIRRYTLDSLRAQIGVVLQDGLLFAASIRDNIVGGSPDYTPQAVEQAARLANAHEFIMQLPQGYDTVLGERGVTLSNGQRQRLAIARAIIRRTPIVILDEPTTGLDDDNERQVIEALEHLTEGRTVFMITHDLQLALRADRILYIDGGVLQAWGDHQTLLRGNARYASLFQDEPMTSNANVNRTSHAELG